MASHRIQAALALVAPTILSSVICKSRHPGRPPLPGNISELIRQIAQENPTWGEQRIAGELSLKLGIHVAPRTVAKYLDSPRPHGTAGNQRWSTFVHNHAKGMVACDFFVSVTATFRILYVFVAMEIDSRRILHTNVTAHPTADWTIQQFRQFLAFDHPYRFLIHDRGGIFSSRLDAELNGFGVHVLKTPPRTPTANAFCERLVGSIRRECLDYLIPINERHLRRTTIFTRKASSKTLRRCPLFTTTVEAEGVASPFAWPLVIPSYAETCNR
jgi:putative transposase